jgi:hypothetical protein
MHPWVLVNFRVVKKNNHLFVLAVLVDSQLANRFEQEVFEEHSVTRALNLLHC